MNEKELQISDDVWHRVVQVVQLAMLTGVDVADYLRLIRVVEENGKLNISSTSNDQFKKIIDELGEKLQKLQEYAETGEGEGLN